MPTITVGSGTGFHHDNIQSAIDAADPDDVIQIASGTYSNVVIDKSSITLEAADGANVTIDGPGLANQAGIVVAQGVEDVTINGLVVNAVAGDLAAVYAVGNNTNLDFSGNELNGGSAGHAFLAGGSGGAGMSESSFTGNTFTGSGISGGNSSVIYVNGQASLSVMSFDNTFSGNTISGAPSGGLLMGIESFSSTITGNTFSGTASYAQLEIFGAGSTIDTNDFSADGPAFRDSTGTYDLAVIASDNGLTPAYSVGNAVFNDPADAAAAAGTTGTAMDLATGNFVVFEGMSIQAAVTAAVDGDTVEVGTGTFILPSTLNVDKGITLLGQGEGATVIDASALVNSYGISSHGDGADGVAFEGFTLYGPANLVGTAYGLKISDVDGVSVTDVTVQGSGRTEVDLNGVTNATLTNVTANGASLAGLETPGVGFAVSSSSNVTFTDIATDGLNAWGGVALFSGGGAYDLDVSGIVFNGNFDVIEPGMIYAQEKNGKTVTIDTPPFEDVWTVQNDTFRAPLADSEEYTFFFGSQAEAEGFATGLPSPERSVVRNSDGDLFVADGMSIQAAVDAAANGDTIVVGAGNFAENLNVNKSVTIEGANAGTGAGDERVAETSLTGGIRISGDGTTIDGLEILEGQTGGGGEWGVYVQAADASILNNVMIRDVLTGDFKGVINASGTGEGLLVDSNSFTNWTRGVWINPGADATVTNNSFTDGGNGINIDGSEDIVSVAGNTFTNSAGAHIGIAVLDDGNLNGGTLDVGAFLGSNTFDTKPTQASIYFYDADKTAIGTDYAESFYGKGFWSGPGGDNEMIGNGGADNFYGGPGNETFRAGTEDAIVDGGAGFDTVIFAEGTDPTAVAAMTGISNVEKILIEGTEANTHLVMDGMSLQAVIDSAADGDTILVFPGNYVETANYNPADNTNSGTNPLSLLINKSLTIQGVDAAGNAITDSDDIVATVTGQTQSGWGTHFFVTAPDVSIQGLGFVAEGQDYGGVYGMGVNKAFEIIETGFALEDSTVSAPNGTWMASSIYINDGNVTTNVDLNTFTSAISTYLIDDNVLNGSVAITNGPGYGIDESEISFVISNNIFQNNPGNTVALYDNTGVSVTGADDDVAWRNAPAVAPEITGNVFSADMARLLRVSDDDTDFIPDAAYFADFLANNETPVFAYAMDGTALRVNVDSNGNSSAAIRTNLQEALDDAQSGDSVVARTNTDPVTATVNVSGLSVEILDGSGPVSLTLASGIADLTLLGDQDVDVTGSDAANTIIGNAGDNTIFASAANDMIDGGDGIDTLDVSAAGASGAFVDLNAGTAFSSVTGFDSLNSIERVVGSSGNDALLGDAGDNIFVASAGNDTVNGRGGNDTFDASAATTGVAVNLGGAVSGAFTASLSNVENVITGSGNDNVTGTAADNNIATGAGDDIVTLAGGGNDTVDGGEGMDRVVLAGNRSDYEIEWDGTTATVSNGTDEATLTGVGQIGFADLTVFLVADGGDYSTLASAVGAASAGDEVLLAAGTYTETVTINKQLAIHGANAGLAAGDAGRGAESIIDGGLLITGDGVTLDGVSVANGATVGGENAGVMAWADDLTVTNSVFDGANTHRAIITGNNLATNLTVTDSSFDGWASGMFVNPGMTGLSVTGNTFTNNGSGVNIDGPGGLGGIGLVENNTFIDSVGSHTALGSWASGEIDASAVFGENTFSAGSTPTSVWGTGGNDTITGTDEANSLNAGGGDDRLIGGAGDDTVRGDAGTDTLVLSGNVADYSWAAAPGGFTITDEREGSPDGTDTVENVEFVEFLDATFAASDFFAPIQVYDEEGDFAGGFTSIQAAIDASETDYTIEVSAGIYDGDVTVDKAVTLIGSMGDVAFDDAARGTGEAVIGGRVQITADGAVLNGFTLSKPSSSTNTETGMNFTDWGGNNLTVAADNVTVSNTIVEAFGAHGGFSGSGFVSLAGDGTSFQGNLVTAGTGYDAANDARGVAGIWVNGAEGDAIGVFDNRVEVSTDNADGISVMAGDATVTDNVIDGTDGGFVAWNSYGNLVFTGNDISNVSAETIRILASSLNPEVLVENNTFDNDDRITFNLSGDSTVEGGAGDDIANAFATEAAVVFDGGDGADSFRPGMGGGLFFGGAGIDTLDLTGTTTDASVDLNAGTASSGQVGATALSSVENATGGDGNDVLLGNAVANMLVGGAGNDTLDGGAGDDTLDGGSGSDTVSHQTATQAVFVNLAAGTAFGTEIGTDTLISVENVSTGSGNDVVFGSSAANMIATGAGNDLVYAGGDNDTILVGAGNNTVYGDAGDDTAVFTGDWTSYTITDTGGDSFDISDGTFTSSFSSVENFTFDGETLAAADLVNVAPDSLTFDDDTPTVIEDDSGAVVAEVFATDPNALDELSYTVDDARFEVVDDGGNILLQLKDGEALTRLDDGIEVEVTVTDAAGLSLSEAVTIEVQNVNQPPGGGTPLTTWSPAAIEAGSRRADLAPEAVVSDPDGDTLTYTYATALTAGAFYLGDTLVALGTELDEAEFQALTYMSPETDGIYTAEFSVSDGELNTPLTVSLEVTAGVDGNFSGSLGADMIDGAAGNDTIAADAGNDTVYGGSGDDLIRGNEDDDLLFGNAGADVMAGNDGNDTMAGGTGEDRIYGGAGDDDLNGDQDNDLVEGGTGSDVIRGGTGNDLLRGENGNDTLAGNSGDDALEGGAGADVLIGGGGTDLMTGGAGADVFVFSSVAHSFHGGARDTIVDFETGIDKIDLTGFGGLVFTGSTYTGAGNEVRYNGDIGRLYVDIDGDTASDFSVDLNGNPALTVDDLLL